MQAEHSLPIHLASMTRADAALLGEVSGDDIAEGDIFIANDPHVAGGTHLPDINMAMPVFVDGSRWSASSATSRTTPTSAAWRRAAWPAACRRSTRKGCASRSMRLFRKGELQQDLLDLILLNVRVPRRAARRLFRPDRRLPARRAAHAGDLPQRYGARRCSTRLRRDHRPHRDAHARRDRRDPDGVYRFADVMDDDGMGTTRHPDHAAHRRRRASASRFDFAGTAPQVTGNINVHAATPRRRRSATRSRRCSIPTCRTTRACSTSLEIVRRARLAAQLACSPRRWPRAPTPASASST